MVGTNLEEKSLEARKIATKISADGKAAHCGSCLSVIDILVSLYFGVFDKGLAPNSPDRPNIILSKGHSVGALYAILYLKGYMGVDTLRTYHKNGGLPAHADTSTNGVDFSTGSLGHGLAVGTGMALSAKIDGRKTPTIVVMGDGECQEGEVWEAVNFAVAKKISSLVVVVDSNGLQAYDSAKILGPNIAEKWAGFGWKVIKCNGHDLNALCDSVRSALSYGSPSVVIAETTKGRGMPSLEGKVESHYRTPKGDEFGDPFENGCGNKA